ncbi:HAD family phosphatase [Thiohalobacter sp. IOR34]|uniref:HAD family hydrolase n=1 Tax=Thiohalobacter sp. IOR34 TaxID=3057176 RepID=UPI0025B26408|nr:HAD family phosphatase [Thiohalobacter sp. IOR34]WJW76410.1 HAD family phosphatase [Thiohalobacter sp. IOR34]
MQRKMEQGNNGKIRALLFDFGGVIAEEGFRNGLRALAEQQGLDAERLPQAGMEAVYDSGFVVGRGSAADFWELLRKRTGLRGTDEELTGAILSGFVVRPWILDKVARLRSRGYTTAILSDQTHWLDELDARYHFKDFFDHVFNSYYLGKGKRDPSLFDDVVAELGLEPQQALFIDDDPGNLQRARSRGLQTWLFSGRAAFESLVQRLLGAAPDDEIAARRS